MQYFRRMDRDRQTDCHTELWNINRVGNEANDDDNPSKGLTVKRTGRGHESLNHSRYIMMIIIIMIIIMTTMMMMMMMTTCWRGSHTFIISNKKSGTGRYSKTLNHLDILVSLLSTLFFVVYKFLFFQIISSWCLNVCIENKEGQSYGSSGFDSLSPWGPGFASRKFH
jgi:magnesium-transporting ATPase (P-type)